MLDSIEQYVQHLLQIIAASPVITASNVVMDKRTARSGLIRGDLTLRDSSRLYFRELVHTDLFVSRDMYSFHYQTRDGILIFRYDDTPHHYHLGTFPHHKHAGAEKNVVAAAPPDLQKILVEIEGTVDFGARMSE